MSQPYIYLYSVEADDGTVTWYPDKAQAQALGRMVTEHYFDKEYCAEFMAQKFNHREKSRQAGRLGGIAMQSKMTAEQKADWHRKGGQTRAKQRYGA